MSVEPGSGHVNWRGWALDYDVPNSEGLSLLNGFFRKTRIFTKLSLPVVRVKYLVDQGLGIDPSDGNVKLGCGPYNDQITWDTEDFGEDLLNWARGGPHHLVPIDFCGNRYICVSEVAIGSGTWLQLALYARIGAYHIFQAWYLSEGGHILPRVFSKGLSCEVNHWHHPHWRFDFHDRDPQQVNIYDGSRWNTRFTAEQNFQNSAFGPSVRYSIENGRTGSQVWIQPPTIDQTLGIVGPTPFAPFDGFVRRYRPEEDISWPAPPEQHVEYPQYEMLGHERIVFWSICHLFHQASEGKHHWHGVGPTLEIELSDRVPVKAHERRLITVDVTIKVNNFKLVGTNRIRDFAYRESTEVNPREEYDEFFFDNNSVGDVNAQFLFRVYYQDDLSVRVVCEGQLFDEEERVAYAVDQFFVLRDASVRGSMNLVDYHGGDPDTAAASFRISNLQK